MKSIIVFLIILALFSCEKSQNELESEYQKCINNKTFDRGVLYSLESSDSYVLSSVSVFDSIKKFEHYLYKTENLSEVSKNGYLALVTDIKKAGFLKKEFKEFNSSHNFIEHNLMTALFFEELFYQCTMSAFKNQIQYNYLFETKDKIQLNSYPNSEILTEFVHKVDFKSETQRLILTYLVYYNLYWKYRNQ